MTGSSPPIPEAHKRIIETIIALTLRIGVSASILLVALGACLTFIHHPEYVHDPATLQTLTGKDNDFPKTIPEVLTGLAQFRGQAIIVLGLIVLLATPVFRVAISAIIFWIERDARFVAITLFVLALLVLSFFLGRVEG